MRVSREGDVYIAMRVTGPSHNILKLDFAPAGVRCVSDRAPVASTSVTSGLVEAQVDWAFRSLGEDRAHVSGVVFDSRDTASDVVYRELAQAIIRYRRFGEGHVPLS